MRMEISGQFILIDMETPALPFVLLRVYKLSAIEGRKDGV